MDVAPYAYAVVDKFILKAGLLAVVILVIVYLASRRPPASIPANPTTRHAPVRHRGKFQNTCDSPIWPLFHPNARVGLEGPNDYFFCVTMWLHGVFGPAVYAIASAGLAAVVGKHRAIFSITNLKERVGPLSTRFKRGLARLSTLQDAFTFQIMAFYVPWRYFCPTFFLLGLFVGLVFVVGAPIEAAAWPCAGGFTLVVVGDVGASEPQGGEEDEEEVDDAPLDVDMNSTTDTDGLFPIAALQAQT